MKNSSDMFNKKLPILIMQCNSPGYVATQLVGLKKATWWAVDPVAYGRSSVATIGLQHHTNGCLYHVIQVT